MQQSKMSVAARRRAIVYGIEQAILSVVMVAGFCGVLIAFRFLLNLA